MYIFENLFFDDRSIAKDIMSIFYIFDRVHHLGKEVAKGSHYYISRLMTE